MPPTIEQYIHNNAHLLMEEKAGDLTEMEVNCTELVATRPFLVKVRLNGNRRRNSREIPDIIKYLDILYVIDGHHKVRNAIDNGQKTIKSRVLTTKNLRLGEKLIRSDCGLVANLPVCNIRASQNFILRRW